MNLKPRAIPAAVIALFLGVSLGGEVSHAEAPPPFTVPAVVKNFDELYDVVCNPLNPNPKDACTAEDPEKNIWANVDQLAMCGGWDFTKNVEEYMPKITGLPGRKGDFDGNITSGMAERIETGGRFGDGFEFPRQAGNPPAPWGLSTACRPVDWRTKKEVTETDLRRIPPFFKDHPCERPLGDIKSQNGNADGIRYSCGGSTVQNRTDGGLCEDLNEKWLYYLYRFNTGTPDAPVYIYRKGKCGSRNERQGERLSMQASGWSVVGDYYCCTDKPVGHPDANCVKCSLEMQEGGMSPGETGCRIGREVTVTTSTNWPFILGVSPPTPGITIVKRTYISYFRQYRADFMRKALGEDLVPEEETERLKIPVSCYGMYDEYDVKKVVSEFPDRSCVMNFYRENPDTDFSDMAEHQKGKGSFGEDSGLPDPNPEETEQLRKPDYFADEPGKREIWYPNFGGGISFLMGDPTQALLDLDGSKFKVIYQMTEEEPLSSGSLLRAFDDTVAKALAGETHDNDRRTIVEWWQEIETRMNTFFTPPVVRMLLPTAWMVDLDPLKRFLAVEEIRETPIASIIPEIPEEEETEKNRKPPKLTDAMEVQLIAGEDLLGEVQAYLRRSLLQNVREEPINVLIPMADELELLGWIKGWEEWRDYWKDRGEDVSGADQVIQKFEGYRTQIVNVRLLRAELVEYAALFLRNQREVAVTIGAWMVQNVAEYEAFEQSKRTLFASKPEWEELQQVYRVFHDQSSYPWCMNARFSTLVYSFLDTWLRSRPDLNGGLDAAAMQPTRGTSVSRDVLGPQQALPQLPMVERIPDVVLDFTALKVATGSVRMPVLKPIQVRIDPEAIRPPALHETPAAAAERIEKLKKLADLPPVPSIKEDIEKLSPTVEGKKRPLAVASFIPDLTTTRDPAPIAAKLKEIRKVIEEMKAEYDLFWEAVTKTRDEVKDGTEDDCVLPHSGNCVHEENDLRERAQRIWVRPAIFLKEDFASIGKRRDPGNDEEHQWDDCAREDYGCHLLNGQERYPREGWNIISSDDGADERFDELRSRMVKETLLIEGANDLTKGFPYIRGRDAIMPSFHVPAEIKLTPELVLPDITRSLRSLVP